MAWSNAIKEDKSFINPIMKNKFSIGGLRAQEKREEEQQEQKQEQEKRGLRGRGVSHGVLPPYMLQERFLASKYVCMIVYVCVYACSSTRFLVFLCV